MAIDFPTSPSVGDTTTADGIAYKWDGSSWVITTGAVRNAVDTMSSGTIDYNAGSYHVLDLDSTSSSATLSVSNLPTTPEKHTLQVNFTEELATSLIDGVSVSAQDSSPSGIFFKSDGTRMYMIGATNDTVYQYTLSTAWDLSTASYDSVSFSVASQDTLPTDLFFKPDGTKMYVLGDSNDRVYQYTLSTAWDLSTASYDSVSYFINISTTSLFFDASGTRMFIIDFSYNRVIYYPLSVAWDISSASYTGSTFSITQDSNPYGVTFKSDGTKMYIIGYGSDNVYQYTLSTAWNLSTVSYDSVSFSVASQDTGPLGIAFNSDGTRMYIIGSVGKSIYQYTLSTAWDLSTASYTGLVYDNVSFSVSTQETSPYGIFFKSDGTKMYMVGPINDRVYQYTLSTAWDLSTASYDSVSFSVASQDSLPIDIFFSSDGTRMYILGYINDTVFKYTLSTAWDLSTASYDSVSFSVTSQESDPYGIFFKSDGTKMYMVGFTNDTVYQYTLSTAWDLSTASYDSVSFSVASQETSPWGIFFKSDGTKMYIIGTIGKSVYQYTLSTPWDLSTASYDSVSFSVASQDSLPVNIFINSDGTRVYILGSTNDTVYQYSSITVSYDVTWPSEFEFNENTSPTSPTTQSSLILELYNPDNTKIYATQKFNNG